MNKHAVLLYKRRFTAFSVAIVIILCFFAVSTGCAGADSDKKDIENIISKAVSCTKEQAEKFNDFVMADGESKEGVAVESKNLSVYLNDEYRDILTENCIDNMAKNRYFLACKSLVEDYGSDIAVKEIEITKSDSDGFIYYYTAKLTAGGNNVGTAEGTVRLSDTEKHKADLFTVKIKEE